MTFLGEIFLTQELYASVEVVGSHIFMLLRDAIRKAEKGSDPITLLVKERDQIKSVAVDYHGGLRIPHLERVDGTPARLDDVLAAVP